MGSDFDLAVSSGLWKHPVAALEGALDKEVASIKADVATLVGGEGWTMSVERTDMFCTKYNLTVWAGTACNVFRIRTVRDQKDAAYKIASWLERWL